MKEKEFKNNNSNKLIIGISIIFCTVILIVGVTTAYFTQSTSKEMDTIVSNDQQLLEYKDDLNNYMRGDLIPTTKENAITAYNREGDKKCIDDYGYSACSIYRFSIKNISNVSQTLIMTLNPTANSFSNLKFMLYEITEEGNNLIQDTTDLIKENYEPIPLYKSYDLEDNKTRTFELVFYIEAKDEDQTGVDSGKRFGAGIKINSISTGKYIVKNFGSNCWELDETNPEKLVKFNGINHDTGEIDEMCTGYVSQDENGYYSVNIPSNVGGQDVTIIGNNLFRAYYYDEENDEEVILKYHNIKEVQIQDGITEIEDGGIESLSGAFMFIGSFNSDSRYKLDISLPETLTRIGALTFYSAALSSLNIPKNVEEIGFGAFADDMELDKLETLTFGGTENNTNKLKIIGESAFHGCNISSIILPSNVIKIEASAFTRTLLTHITIPSSVEEIGEEAFAYNENLTSVTFADTKESPSKLKVLSGFNETGISTIIIPSSVEEIGEGAFANNSNLTSLTFAVAEDGTSRLRNIGKNAFEYSKISSLTIPKSVETIEECAFENSTNLTELTFMSESDGTSDLRYIGASAFGETSVLKSRDKSLFIPSSVTYIGSGAFSCYKCGGATIRFAGDPAGFATNWNSGNYVVKEW